MSKNYDFLRSYLRVLHNYTIVLVYRRHCPDLFHPIAFIS